MSRKDPRIWVTGLVIALLVSSLPSCARQDAVRADSPVLTLEEYDRIAARRHGELVIKIESLRRQMLTLHGKRWVEEK